MKRVLTFAALLACSAGAAAEARLLRMPDIHGETVAFVYAGDIYTAAVSGGTARRLTAHAGKEIFPKFSRDGRWLAFSAEYSGNRQVYVMPADGSEAPRQISFYNDVGELPPRGGYDYRVLDWTPDGNHVLVRANRLPWGPRMGRPYLIPLDGGLAVPLAVPESGGGMLSANGSELVYTPIDREFRTWKRYRGGRAQDVWVYDLDANSSRQLTDHPATDNQPVWLDGQIYFTSDRDYTLNLYRHVDGGEPVAVTSHDEFDVLWPSAGPEAIVYENGGRLYRYSPAVANARPLSIRIAGDRRQARPRFVDAGETIESATLLPGGKRAVFAARGELFSVPLGDGVTRRLTRTPGEREIHVATAADGEALYYQSDKTGEYEIYRRAADGSGDATALTRDSSVWRMAPRPSPDGRFLAFTDVNNELTLLDVRNGRQRVIDDSTVGSIGDYRWAPDSRWLAYVKPSRAGFGSLWVYSIDERESMRLTDDATNDSEPVFDPAGRYLYFLSDRDFNLTFSSYQFNYVNTRAGRVYAAALNRSVPALRAPAAGDTEQSEDDPDDGNDEIRVVIEPDGFGERIVALTESGSDVGNLEANEAGPLWLDGESGQGNGQPATLRQYVLAEREVKTVLEQAMSFSLSPDGEHLLFQSDDGYGVVAAKPDQSPDEAMLDLDGLTIRIDPALEWAQIYTDAWRILRDWFYDPNLHGQDWQAIHDKYRPLVDHVADRSDLDYLLGEIAGELNAGHVYVQSGDDVSPERHDGGLLGAEFSRHDSGFFRIERLFRGESWHQEFRSPLAEPYVGAEAGDFVVAIDGVATSTVNNLYRLLEGKAGALVAIELNDQPSRRGAREVLVTPIASETSLRYLDWVESRAAMVERLSDGRIGYLHLPNTATAGQRELFKRYLPQVDKEALLIDVRYNGGGFIPDRMVELVARTPLSYWKRRGLDPTATPVVSHDGPKAALINGMSSSGGDAFPYYFRKLGLGPLIGTRTWGGLIGISGNPGLVDGGTVLAATFRFLDTDGNWAVENEGVAPDIEVVDRPEAIAAGRDPSLERAVGYLLDELARQPRESVTAPAAPTDFGRD